MSEPDVNVLVCPPVEIHKQREIGIMAMTPAPGATETVCQSCGVKIWIGPLQRAKRESDPRFQAWCFACVLKHASPEDFTEIKNLGGRGGSYLLDPTQVKLKRK